MSPTTEEVEMYCTSVADARLEYSANCHFIPQTRLPGLPMRRVFYGAVSTTQRWTLLDDSEAPDCADSFGEEGEGGVV